MSTQSNPALRLPPSVYALIASFLPFEQAFALFLALPSLFKKYIPGKSFVFEYLDEIYPDSNCQYYVKNFHYNPYLKRVNLVLHPICERGEVHRQCCILVDDCRFTECSLENHYFPHFKYTLRSPELSIFQKDYKLSFENIGWTYKNEPDRSILLPLGYWRDVKNYLRRWREHYPWDDVPSDDEGIRIYEARQCGDIAFFD